MKKALITLLVCMLSLGLVETSLAQVGEVKRGKVKVTKKTTSATKKIAGKTYRTGKTVTRKVARGTVKGAKMTASRTKKIYRAATKPSKN
jgi:hypothetical protein